MSLIINFFADLEAGDLDAVRAALDAEPSLAHSRLAKPDADGKLPTRSDTPTALQAAACAGHADIVRLLLERGADLNAIAQWGYPALCHAVWKKQDAIVALLLAEDAKQPNAPSYGLGLDVNLAARSGWTDTVRRHIELDPLAVHRRGVIGETPLHWAAHNGYTEIVTLLLDAGADLEADEIGLYGGKPLHWCAEHEPHILKLLLERGAVVDSRNLKTGDTPLIMCARQRDDCVECARLLLDAGADPRVVNHDGKTALDYAAARDGSQVAALLRQALDGGNA